MIRSRKMAGDTIIEVLLAMAVISVVLGSTYVVVNRSFRTTRQAQERSEAVKLLESQLEQIKVLVKDPNSGISTVNEVFCINSSGGISVQSSPSFADDCQKFGTVPGYYRLELTKTGDLYSAIIQWDSANGSGVDRASLLYKVYP